MKHNEITKLKSKFDEIAHILENSDIECWYARELMLILGYTQWRNFLGVIEKAKIACKATEIDISDHFADVSKMVDIGSGSTRELDDVLLTRYACYLISQNGDPRKEEISFAQTYFAIQTRKQELIETHLSVQERIKARQKLTESETELSKNIFERGVDEQGFGRIRSKGDKELFGGYNTQKMKDKLSIPQSRPLADFLPTVTIAAKNLATEMTNYNTQKNDLQGENPITDEHIQNNRTVRNMLTERGIKPEELPVEEDLKKLERKVKSSEKKMIKESSLPNKLSKKKTKMQDEE